MQAIEAKNLIGRYDTSLYLKAQVDNLTGHNEELRKELKEARFDATKANIELEKAKGKVDIYWAILPLFVLKSAVTKKILHVCCGCLMVM